MNTRLPASVQEEIYEKYAREYLRSLPLEHFMESTNQSTQREITLESLALVKAKRADVQVFSDLMAVQPAPFALLAQALVPGRATRIGARAGGLSHPLCRSDSSSALVCSVFGYSVFSRFA